MAVINRFTCISPHCCFPDSVTRWLNQSKMFRQLFLEETSSFRYSLHNQPGFEWNMHGRWCRWRDVNVILCSNGMLLGAGFVTNHNMTDNFYYTLIARKERLEFHGTRYSHCYQILFATVIRYFLSCCYCQELKLQ